VGNDEVKHLDIDCVTMRYNHNETEQIVLNDVSLSVEKGTFLCIVGASGCGKTTLLRIMAGFTKPTHGSVSCNGKKVEKPWMEGSYIFQEQDQLLPWKTANQNVAYPMQIKNVSKKDREIKADEYLAKVGLDIEKDSKKYPHQLSVGMKQRVAIARALAMQPEILFMDEPFSSVDKYTRDKLHEDFLKLWKGLNLTVVLITHDIDEAIRLSSRIIILGKNYTGIIGDYINNVGGERHPTDEGYPELWNSIYNGIKERNSV
jgi:NitT/TauT family transport system ATP-binding protein